MIRNNSIKYDTVFKERATTMSKAVIKQAETLVNDLQKTERLKKNLCRTCYYIQRIGGSAMTETECCICHKKLVSSSTNIDILCEDCAAKQKACKHCGCKINI